VEIAGSNKIRWLAAAYKHEYSKSKHVRKDLEAGSTLRRRGCCLDHKGVAGTIPGIPVGTTFVYRAELCLVGIHYPPVAGIDAVRLGPNDPRPSPAPGSPPYPGAGAASADLVRQEYTGGFATSVMMSGHYEDDQDAKGSERFEYTGEGGNSITGNHQQIADQTLTRNNEKLLGNITLKIPVRVFRKNPDGSSYSGIRFTYDGLYWVVACRKVRGLRNFWVYKYDFVRVQGQPERTSAEVQWGKKNIKKESIPRGLIEGPDLSLGLNRYANGQPNPIPVVNTADTVPAPISLLPEDAETPENLALRNDLAKKAFVYATRNFHAPSVPVPPPVPPEECTLDRLRHLNGGRAPYIPAGKANGGIFVLPSARDVVYELPFFGSEKPKFSAFRATHAGCNYRLELFKTAFPSKGWGVRTLDRIPGMAFVVEFTGLIRHTKDFEAVEAAAKAAGTTGKCSPADYAFGLEIVERPDDDEKRPHRGRKGDGSKRRPHQCSGSQRRRLETSTPGVLSKEAVSDTSGGGAPQSTPRDDDDEEEVPVSKYTLDGYPFGNVSRYINHDLDDPNLFTVNVLSEHHDREQVRICLFASRDIRPGEELSYDYGPGYVAARQGAMVNPLPADDSAQRAASTVPPRGTKAWGKRRVGS